MKTLRTYRFVILVSLAAIAIAYALVAAIVFLASPTQRVTSQPFRLDFEGAAAGKFPNGLRFSTADIVSPTILLPVYRRNEMQTYIVPQLQPLRVRWNRTGRMTLLRRSTRPGSQIRD